MVCTQAEVQGATLSFTSKSICHFENVAVFTQYSAPPPTRSLSSVPEVAQFIKNLFFEFEFVLWVSGHNRKVLFCAGSACVVVTLCSGDKMAMLAGDIATADKMDDETEVRDVANNLLFTLRTQFISWH